MQESFTVEQDREEILVGEDPLEERQNPLEERLCFLGVKKQSCGAMEAVIPSTFCFFTFAHSVFGNHRLGR